MINLKDIEFAVDEYVNEHANEIHAIEVADDLLDFVRKNAEGCIDVKKLLDFIRRQQFFEQQVFYRNRRSAAIDRWNRSCKEIAEWEFWRRHYEKNIQQEK